MWCEQIKADVFINHTGQNVGEDESYYRSQNLKEGESYYRSQNLQEGESYAGFSFSGTKLDVKFMM